MMTADQTLTRQDVADLAAYAHLGLEEGELDEMCAYLNEAIGLLAPLRSYDLDGVAPTYHPIGGRVNVLRDDDVREGLSVEDALGQASSREGRLFRVPSILGEGDEA